MEHDGCKGCKYEHCSADSKECRGCKQNAVDKYTKMTQADRIRSMSDEELAEFLGPFDACCYCKASEQECCTTDDCDKYQKSELMKWLQSEVEVGE